MTPQTLLNEILILSRDSLSDPRREYVLASRCFQEAALNLETFPVESMLKALEVMKNSKGSCIKCGGFTVPRNGVHFDNERRCIICHHIF